MSVLQKLTEGIVHRDVGREGQEILNKWEATGLLEGLDNERTKATMSVLLENQAKELLREASSMAAGDVEGFAAVAFPIVRRVFGGLIANELVSVQPMSLPSGLIFFLDFTKESARGGGTAGESLYGGDRVASQITGGVDLTGPGEEQSFYNLSTAYSNATGSFTVDTQANTTLTDGPVASRPVAVSKKLNFDADLVDKHVLIFEPTAAQSAKAGDLASLAQIDAGMPQAVSLAPGSAVDSSSAAQIHACIVDARDGDLYVLLNGADNAVGDVGGDNDDVDQLLRLRMIRRLTKFHTTSTNGLRAVTGVSQLVFEIISSGDCGVANGQNADAKDGNNFVTQAQLEAEITAATLHDLSAADKTALGAVLIEGDANWKLAFRAPIKDELTSGSGLGAIVGTDVWGLEEPEPGTGNEGSGVGKNTIAEIDIKVDSIAVTAQTKKLKAKWTPELAQDLNAYHNLDAEVELTGILSEQIALEIDQEILGDLVKGATAGTMYWSRRPGKFVNRTTAAHVEDWSTGGIDSNNNLLGADFTGTVSEWYETLVETINDVSAQIHRKTLRGGANFLVCGPEVANILEFTSGFRANITHDQEKGTVGAVKAGSLSKKWDVYVDPYFMRNVILVGRKGSSFLESGFVYAPYVPLQTTPTIFGTEDFVPRKGVMTRYAKKMVRPDLYGLVVVQDLLG